VRLSSKRERTSFVGALNRSSSRIGFLRHPSRRRLGGRARRERWARVGVRPASRACLMRAVGPDVSFSS